MASNASDGDQSRAVTIEPRKIQCSLDNPIFMLLSCCCLTSNPDLGAAAIPVKPIRSCENCRGFTERNGRGKEVGCLLKDKTALASHNKRLDLLISGKLRPQTLVLTVSNRAPSKETTKEETRSGFLLARITCAYFVTPHQDPRRKHHVRRCEPSVDRCRLPHMGRRAP